MTSVEAGSVFSRRLSHNEAVQMSSEFLISDTKCSGESGRLQTFMGGLFVNYFNDFGRRRLVIQLPMLD